MPARLLPALALLGLLVALPIIFKLAVIALTDSSLPPVLVRRSSQQVVVSVSGQVARPGIYSLLAGASLKELLALVQPQFGLTTIPLALDNTPLVTGHEYHFSPQIEKGFVVRPLGMRTRMVLGLRLDINLASAEELDALPYVSQKVALRIVEYRERHGPFLETTDLLKVKGVGPRLFREIKDMIAVGQESARGLEASRR